MTEDILFDNIYIGHSVEDADKLAKETYFVKHALEEAADKAANKVDEEDAESTVSLKEDPVAFIRQKVLTFVEAAKVDPGNAFKSQPETGAALAVHATTARRRMRMRRQMKETKIWWRSRMVVQRTRDPKR